VLDVRKTFREVANEHIEEYDEGNEKRLTGKHEISSMNEFKFGLAFDFFFKSFRSPSFTKSGDPKTLYFPR